MRTVIAVKRFEFMPHRKEICLIVHELRQQNLAKAISCRFGLDISNNFLLIRVTYVIISEWHSLLGKHIF